VKSISTDASTEKRGRGGEKYQLILDSAISVIAEKGYFQARVSDFAERAGVADGTIYLYFKSKEQILMAAMDSAFTQFIGRARQEMTETREPREQLRRLGHLHLEMLGANRELAIVVQTELRQSAKFLKQFSRSRLLEYFDLIRTIIREGQRTGVFRPELSDKIAVKPLTASSERSMKWRLHGC
jgi:TetR/AcrR family transcriptional regulator, fatty acid metabolism regulator protein